MSHVQFVSALGEAACGHYWGRGLRVRDEVISDEKNNVIFSHKSWARVLLSVMWDWDIYPSQGISKG